VQTSGYGGRRLQKNVTVHTDDKEHPRLNFTISGNVEKFVNINPKRVYLRGFSGTQIKTSVSIIPVEKYPFKIIEAKAINGKYISYKIEEDVSSKANAYILTIENEKKEKGSYFDTIDLKTDSTIQPLLKIRIYGNILPRQQKKQE